MNNYNASTLKDLCLLIVEDEPSLRQAMADFLSLYCRRVIMAANGVAALDVFTTEAPDLVLTDIVMPQMDGITFTERLRELSPETPVVLYSAFTDVPNLIRGIELGVAGFIPKPANDERLISVLEKAALPVIQRKQLAGLQKELRQSVEQFIGKSPKLKTIADQVSRIARSNFSLLIQGETGTGKSRLAALIHDLGPLAEKPFISVQLGALPEALVAEQLFGNEKGAITDINERRAGLIEAAKGGTLFLDDIDAASLSVQTLLLQLVEEKSYTPLGNHCKQHADVRIIAASNKDLARQATLGEFRQDLYYRLAGLVIEMPPLRAIVEDIAPLSQKFIREVSHQLQCEVPEITDDAILLLKSCSWPGNIRELQNVMKRAMMVAVDVIDAALLKEIIGDVDTPYDPYMDLTDSADFSPVNEINEMPLAMSAVEKWALKRALIAADGKLMLAARLLEMNYYTFRRRLARYNMVESNSVPD